MKNTYIEKLLSHIGNKKHKQQIEYELTDHITEKENWYMELEYDPETASCRAEEDMGDPDIAGEELAAIHSGKDKKSGWIAALMLILPLLGFATVFLFTESGEPPYSAFGFYHILFFPLLCFMLATMIYSFRKQRIAALIISSVVSAGVLYSEKFCALLLTTGRDIGKFVLSDYSDYMETDTFFIEKLLTDNGFSMFLLNCVRITLLFIAVIYAVVSLVIIIKNKKLINRRYDYYIGRGIRSFLSVFAAVILVSFSVQSYRLITFKENYTQNVAEIIPERNKKVIEAVYNYMESGSLDFSDISNELDLTNNPYCCTHGGEDGPVCGTYAAEFYNMLNGITYAPFEKESADSMIDFVRSGGKYIEDAPMCCELTFDGEDRIILSCYTDYYGLTQLSFEYRDGRFQLAETKICTETDVKLSDEQLAQFYDAYIACKKDITEHLALIDDPRYEFHVFSKTFGITYNEFDDIYSIYFECCPIGLTEIDGKLYVDNDIVFSNRMTHSADFRIQNEKIVILNNTFDFDDGHGLYSDSYRKALKEESNWHSKLNAKYTELDGKQLKFYERTNSVERFAKRCFISAPLAGSIDFDSGRKYSLEEYNDVYLGNLKNIR